MPKLLYMDLLNLRSKKTKLNNHEKSDHHPCIYLKSDHPEEILFLEGLKLVKRTIGSLKILKGLTIDLDPYAGYLLKWSLYPKAALTSMLLSLDYLVKGEWKKAGECISNINLLFVKRNEVWPRYLKSKADWERGMGKSKKRNEILKECRV